MAVPASGALNLKKVNNERLNCVYSNTYSPTAFIAPASIRGQYYAGTVGDNGNSLPAKLIKYFQGLSKQIYTV